MSDTPIHDMSRAVGALESSVKTLTATWARQDAQATEGRRLLHGKVDELRTQQAILTGQVAQQTQELAEVKPALKPGDYTLKMKIVDTVSKQSYTVEQSFKVSG